MIVQDSLGSVRTRRKHERVCDDGSSVVPKCCYFSNDFTPVGKRASSGGKVLTVNKERTRPPQAWGETVFRSPVVQVVWEERKKKAEVLILCVAANREVD